MTNPDAQTGICAGCYTYLAAPTVSAVTPTEGPTAGGTTITVTGSNFAPGATTVTVGGAAATSVVVTGSTQLTANAPAAANAGPVPVVVTVDRQASNNDIQFSYFAAPTVSSVSPVSGSQYGGTSVTINGSNFAGTPGSSFAGTVTLGALMTVIRRKRHAGPLCRFSIPPAHLSPSMRTRAFGRPLSSAARKPAS